VPPGRLALILALAIAPATRADDPPKPAPDVTSPPAFGDFVVIPLRVHVLTSAELPEIDCALKDDDIRRVIGKVNAIWRNAGVHFALDPIAREPAAREDRFREVRARREGDGLGPFQLLAPEGSRSGEGFDVYYIHRFAVNGVFLGDRMAFVQETASLRPVPGGSDEPLPRVTAHELGHGLGLPHRQDRTNLLASGTTGTGLSEQEATRARDHARKIPGALAAPDLRKKAEEATARGDTAEARRLWSHLADLPGDGAAEARKKLGEIEGENKAATPSR